MPTQSLESAIENYGIQLCRTHPLLKGKTMVHSDREAKVNATCLVFEASIGRDQLEGIKGKEVTLQIEYRSHGATAAQNDAIMAAVDETFTDAYIQTMIGKISAEKPFAGVGGWLMRMDDKESDRNDTPSLRKRTRRIPFVARLA